MSEPQAAAKISGTIGAPHNQNSKVVIITGAAGFIASAVTIDLARDHHIVAIDRREPAVPLYDAAPTVRWEIRDIRDKSDLLDTFRAAKAEFGHIDFVLHFAAFYHFGTDWQKEYQNTNIDGTANVLSAARQVGVSRLIFASSIAAMAPPAPGSVLTAASPTTDSIPYAKSKRFGEQLLLAAKNDVPAIVLRIGGVFSDWGELPPLYSLIRLWTGPGPAGRVVPGYGESGIPYIHRADLVSLVRACLTHHNKLGRFEIFLASQPGAVTHNQLFPIIRQAAGGSGTSTPIHLHPALVRIGLYLRCTYGALAGRMPYERPWMLNYVDRPWRADPTKTQMALNWDCTPSRGILAKIPVIIGNLKSDPATWEKRNRLRNDAKYTYYSK